MDFKLTPQQEMLQKLFRTFTEQEIRPRAAEDDLLSRYPIENVRKMGELGMMGIYFPREYGGAGADILSYILAVEEISKVCASTGVILSGHTSLCAAPIYEHGTEEQKQKWLTRLCKGEIGVFAITEAWAGTDAGGTRTTAILDGDEYVINGTKILITNAGPGDIFLIIAMTDPSRGQKGLSAFIVEKGTPGFSVGAPDEKLGVRASSTCELIFENCRVPKENMLGKENKGFNLAMQTLDGGRIGIAAQALGIAEGALNETVKYVKERKQFGRPLASFQNTQFELAQMRANTEAAKLLVYQAAEAKQRGGYYGVYSSMAKLVAAQNANDVARRCLQLFGGYGFSKEYPIERMFRDAKVTEIYEGTNEVQKMVISADMLK